MSLAIAEIGERVGSGQFITFCHSEPAWFAGEESAVGRQKQVPFGKLRAGPRAIKPRFGMTTF
ncbi:MAG: hypothetical protein ABSA78_11860 [Candidatus Sulfotelmatobacter sp.]|jgi:hypothetical protein